MLKTSAPFAASEVVIDKFPYVIGRNKESDFILPDVKVSGKHAKITVSGNQFFIEDTEQHQPHFRDGPAIKYAPSPARPEQPAHVRFGPDTEVEFQAL